MSRNDWFQKDKVMTNAAFAIHEDLVTQGFDPESDEYYTEIDNKLRGYFPNKFPEGPWCKEGQFVIYGRYAGARFKTNYGEHRILNDDEIIATIKKPEDILALF